MFRTEKEALEALRSTISELEQLTKSWDEKADKAEGDKMAKAEGDEPPAPPADGDGAPAPEADAGEPAGDDGAPAPEGDSTAPEAAPSPEGDAGAEGGEAGGDMMAEIAQEAANLSDEELDMLLHALMQEKDGRHAAAAGPEGAPAPEGDPAAAPEAAPAPEQMAPPAEPEEKSLAMSMKEEFKKLSKSFETQIASLQKTVDSIKAENAQLKKNAAKPTTKPAATNKVEVLEKSVKQPERLSKSEVVNHLLGEVRKGNRNVTRDDVALANAARTDDDLNYVFESLKNKGIEIPAKK